MVSEDLEVSNALHGIAVGSSSILGGPNVTYTAITAICTACMNINKVSRVKYSGGLGPPPAPRFLRLCMVNELHINGLNFHNIVHPIGYRLANM